MSLTSLLLTFRVSDPSCREDIQPDSRETGLIASVSTGRGHTNDVELVESLVTSYIKRPSCIVLLTVACESAYVVPAY
jgi:hypothetical protein